MASRSTDSRGAGAASHGYTAIPSVSRTQQVREQLRAAIERGEHPPGERLPPERELAELLGVSRVSVREAIRSLEALGLVEVRHGRGCFVVASRADDYVRSFSHWLAVHQEEIFDLVMVRGALDELAAEAAARRGGEELAGRLRELNERFGACDPRRDADALVEHDVAFHNALAQASGSVLLGDLLRELHETFNESRRATLQGPEQPERSAREHDAIIAAVARCDPQGARTAVAAHMRSVREALRRLLEADAPSCR